MRANNKIILLGALILVIVSACKKHEIQELRFELTTAQQNKGVLLKWNAGTLTGFKNIKIYRSTSPIPDPAFDKSIDGNLLIASINDITVTSYLDSNISIVSNGVIYYKAVISLTNRSLVSGLEQITPSAFSVTLPSGQSGVGYSITKFPQFNVLYAVNNNLKTISVVDYTNKKILTTILLSGTINKLYPVANGEKPELFVNNSTSITCYDGITLAPKYNINVPAAMRDFVIKNNFLYMLTQNNSIRTYDLSTQALVNERNFYSLASINYAGFFVGQQTLYIKYMNEYVKDGNYIFKNNILSSHLMANIPTDSSVMNISAINADTFNSNNFSTCYYVNLSQDGKYLTCNQNGDIYSIPDKTMHNVRSLSNPNPNILYSDDGKYLLRKTSITTGINFDPIDIYSLPGFNLITSVKSQNSGTVILADDFMDNDTLVSYNVKQVIQGSQTASTLTVLFKKID